MSTEMAPTDPVARERWLEEGLRERDAAAFLGVTREWLAGARGTPGSGPDFKRYSPRLIRYTRRDLIAWRESRTCRSTLDYRPAQDAGNTSSGEGDA